MIDLMRQPVFAVHKWAGYRDDFQRQIACKAQLAMPLPNVWHGVELRMFFGTISARAE